MNLESAIYAADTTRVQAGGKSIFERAADAITYGAGAAAVSGYASIYNTAVYASNNIFGTKIAELDIARTLGDVSSNWRNYYQENKDVIDTVGFIGGAFVPGGLAVKGLNMLRAGEGVGAFGKVLGYTTRKQQEYLQLGLKQIATDGPDVFTALRRKKIAGMMYGVADNVLQAAVFETAAAITMSRGPVLADESWSDISWDIVKTSLAGGAIGGGLQAIWTNRLYKDASMAVEKKARIYDTLNVLDKSAMSFGDRAFSIIDSAMSLPKEVLESDKAVSFATGSKSAPKLFDISGVLDKKLQSTIAKAEELFQAKLTNAVGGDPTVGKSFGKAMVELIRSGKASQKSDGEIREDLLTYLGNLEGIQSLGASTADLTKDVIYLVPGASLRGSTGADAVELFSPVKTGAKDSGYRVIGDHTKGKYGLLGAGEVPATTKEAFEAGFDIVFSGTAGRVHVNPASRIFRAVTGEDDTVVRTVFNTRTKQLTDRPVATIADMSSKGLPTVTDSGVVAGKYIYQFTADNFAPTLDSIQNTARHLWADKVTNLRNATISGQDFSLLDKLVVNPELVARESMSNIKIQMADGSIQLAEDIQGFGGFVRQQKLDVLEATLTAAREAGETVDTRQLAYMLNVDQRWIEDAIAQDFNLAKLDPRAGHRELNSYLERENVILSYKKAPIADGQTPDFPTGMLGYEYRKKLAAEQAESAATFALGKDTERFLDLDPASVSRQFDSSGAGPGIATSSNADYFDPVRRVTQAIGTATHLTMQSFRNAALTPLQGHFAKALTNNNKELGTVLTRIRLSDTRFALYNGKLVDLPSLQKYKQLADKVARGKADPRELEKHEFKQSFDLGEETYALLDDYHKGHRTWLEKQKSLAAAQGRNLAGWHEDALYLPPIDTKQFPFFAFVKAVDGAVMSGTETAMITAKSAEELQLLAAQVQKDHPNLRVLFKKDTEEFFKAKGDYEFQAGLNSPQIDPLLRKAGKLGDFIPTLDPKAVVEDFVRFIGKREDNLVRNAVQVKYGQMFAELDWLSSQYSKVETSKFGFISRGERQKLNDPFGDYKRLALNISKKGEYTLWNEMNEFVDALGTRAYSAMETAYKEARAGDKDWEEANAMLEKFNLTGVFKSQEQYLLAQAGPDRSLVKMAVAKGNVLLANVALRLDAANALINIVSSPIMLGTEVSAIRNSLKRDPELLRQFNAQLELVSPDGSVRIPNTLKLLTGAVNNYWGASKKDLIDRYQMIGAIRDDVSQFHDMLEDLSLLPNMAPGKWAQKVDQWTEKGAKFTGNNFAEQFTRFISADVMRQITQPLVDAGKMGIKEQNSMINIFVNRTQGNYISSQRPIMFQGVIGAAIGLFQTYQFNMFQQLYRHIENKDGKTLAVAAGLQSTIFGLNGLPLFDAINTHLIGNANINEQHHDIYSTIARANKEAGDFALYGALSAFPFFGDEAPALYTRGDLNPRHLTIVPTSFSQVPIVEAFSRVGSAVYGIGNQIIQGAAVGDALMHGLAHNGVSRPLAGLGTVLQGRSTTRQGSMVAAHNDLISIATATRLLGAKPMDESVAMNHNFRMVAYQASDRERIEKLGTVIKQRILDGGLDEEEVLNFAERYAQVGGRVQNYGAALQRWTRAANESQVNTILRAHQTSRGQRLMEVMGGDPLEDYLNSPPPAEE